MDFLKEALRQEVSNLENLVRISNKRHNDAKCKLEKREKILVGLLVDYKLEIKLLKTRTLCGKQRQKGPPSGLGVVND